MADDAQGAMPRTHDHEGGRAGYHVLRVPSTMAGPCREAVAAYALWWLATQRDTREVTQGDNTRDHASDSA